MTNKKKMIEEIIKINNFFIDASNHGSGHGWWYPSKNTIAYNVKMRSFGNVDDIHNKLSEIQKGYYNTDMLLEAMGEALNHEASYLHACITENVTGEFNEYKHLIHSGRYAGRLDGWYELTYSNEFEQFAYDCEADYKEMDIVDIKYYYKQAKELNACEIFVSEYIKDAHKRLNSYIGTDEYYDDIIENYLMCDDDIRDIYKNKIKTYADKL